MTKQAAGPHRFYPALDGLRALAIVAVLISHYFPDRSPIQRAFHWGRFGVLLFFVLSGFLITGLLLRGRDAAVPGGPTKGAVFRTFVIRRALRIAPIYYLVVLVGWWVGYGPVADNLVWHLTYTGNIAMTYFGARLAQATHLWSLCVEEQFYLLWPLVVLFVAAKRLVWIASFLVLFSFGYEIVGAMNGRTFEQTHLVLQGCMDALGLGALLAIFHHRDQQEESGLAQRFALGGAVLGVPLLLFAQGFRYQTGLTATDLLTYRIPSDIGLASCSLVLVYLAISPVRNLVRTFFALAPLRFVGRISYGIYLYHLFLIAIGRAVARSNGTPELPRGLTMFLLYSAISVIVATLSWYAIESPINGQKRRFPYPPKAAPPASAR